MKTIVGILVVVLLIPILIFKDAPWGDGYTSTCSECSRVYTYRRPMQAITLHKKIYCVDDGCTLRYDKVPVKRKNFKYIVKVSK